MWLYKPSNQETLSDLFVWNNLRLCICRDNPDLYQELKDYNKYEIGKLFSSYLLKYLDYCHVEGVPSSYCVNYYYNPLMINNYYFTLKNDNYLYILKTIIKRDKIERYHQEIELYEVDFYRKPLEKVNITKHNSSLYLDERNLEYNLEKLNTHEYNGKYDITLITNYLDQLTPYQYVQAILSYKPCNMFESGK